MQTYQKHLKKFDAYLTLKNFSKATRNAYGCALRQFFAYREKHGMDGPFTQEQAREYILYRHNQGLKWQTINGDYSAMYKFYREVMGLGWDVQHIPRPRKERSLPPVLSQGGVQKIIECGTTFKHQVFMVLLYSTGLRLSEALGLKLTDIDGERLQIRVVKGKGAKDRYVEIPPCLLTLLREYYRAYRPKHLLFNGKRVGSAWAQRSAQWAIKNARSTASHCRHGHHLPDGHTIGQLFRDYGEEYIRVYGASRQTIKLIRSIRVCRTPALGGQRITCKQCGDMRYQYFSCGNSQCPQCQGIKRLQWQDRLACRMLQVPYCHITFTLPHQLNGLVRRYPAVIYNLLLRSSWKTIAQLCGDEDNVGGKPGMTTVLHTWGSDLKYHVHVHCLVTFGGLSSGPKTEWKWPRRKHKLAPFRKLRGAFRAIFLSGLKRLMNKEDVAYHRSFVEMEAELMQKNWVVNHQRPTAETKVVQEYLGRYICRIRNLPPLVAMHLFLQHQLPPYFQRVRHYGLHSGITYAKIKDQLPNKLKRNGRTVRTVIQILRALLAEEPNRCENCGGCSFETELIEPSRHYLNRHALHQGRSPPRSQLSPVEFDAPTGQAPLSR